MSWEANRYEGEWHRQENKLERRKSLLCLLKLTFFFFLIQRFCYSLKKMYHILWGGRITTKHWFYSQGISYSWNQLKHPTPGIVNNAVVEMQTLGSWWDKWKDQNLSQKSEWVECNRTGAETRRNTPGCTWTTLTPTFQKTKPSPSSPHLNSYYSYFEHSKKWLKDKCLSKYGQVEQSIILQSPAGVFLWTLVKFHIF